jgi:Tol biopolymer transport system component
MRTVPVAGGESTILFGGGHGGMGHAGGGSMSPDGSLVTMTGHEIDGPGAALFLSNADGSQRRAISGYGTNPAGTWSPDGSQIVCLSYGGRILVVDIASGDASRVAKGTDATWLDDHTLLVDV